MHIDFPWHYDPRGRTATTDEAEQVRDMIEQFLLTSPGERVNRPEFGSGLLQLVFAPNSPELAATLQFTIQAGLQQWLGDVIEVERLEVTGTDSTVTVALEYVLRGTGERRTDTFTRGAGP